MTFLIKKVTIIVFIPMLKLPQVARNDVVEGIGAILAGFHMRIENTLHIKLPFSVNEVLDKNNAIQALTSYLNELCKSLNKPLVLLIDELDALVGDTLISVLRQLRAGYDTRPEEFPLSVILCGVRDIKDYRIHRSDDEIITGGSCFNIKAESLSIGNFSEDDVRMLLNEHAKETGQTFEEACFPLLMRYTGGQPWLVNALAYEVTFKMKENQHRSVTITPEIIEEAKERLVLSRATHLDQLADKLKEPRVRRVIEPLFIGERSNAHEDDLEYCVDLGLVKKTNVGYVISNEIYSEMLPRELIKKQQDDFLSYYTPEWVNENGSLNTENCLECFSSSGKKIVKYGKTIWQDIRKLHHL